MAGKPLNILFYTNWYPNRFDQQNGVFVQKHAIAVAKKNRVFVIHVLASSEIEKTFEVEEKNKPVKSVTVYYKKGAFKTLNFRRKVKAHTIALTKAKKYLGEIDLTHANITTIGTYFAYKLKRKYGIPYIISEHWSGYHDGTFNGYTKFTQRLFKLITKNAEFILPVSPFLENSMRKTGIEGTYRIIPNIVDIPLGRPKKSNSYKFKFLVVADMVDAVKNVNGVLKAFKELNNPDTELHLIGGGPNADELKTKVDMITSSGYSITWHGRRKNDYVLNEMQRANCVIVNSYHETFSVVTAEALANGIPVIVTKCGGPEHLINESNGILIEPGDTTALKDAMQTIYSTFENFSKKDIKKGISERFSMSTVEDMLNKVYLDALK